MRRRYLIRGEWWTTKWVDAESFSACTDWNTKTIELSHWQLTTRDGSYEPWLAEILAHEILHILKERKSDAGKPHQRWNVRHSDLAKLIVRVERIMRTGRDEE